jgi:branched-chain amino acid transport system permease protein
MFMSLVVDIIKSGLVLTAIYFLLSFAVTFQYGVGGFPNLALGNVGAFGVYVASVLWGAIGLPLAIVVGAVASIAFNLLIQRFIIFKLASGRHDEEVRNNILYGTFALLVALPTIFQKIFPSAMLTVGIPSGGRLFDLFTVFELVLVLVAVAMFIIFRFIIKKTHFGHVIQAVTENNKLSSVMGINVKRVYLVVAGISGFMAFIGLLVWGKLYGVRLETGSEIVIYGFIISVLGGLGNISGALAASVLIGFSYSLTNYLIGGVFTPIVAFVIFTVAIILFPRGLFKSERTL